MSLVLFIATTMSFSCAWQVTGRKKNCFLYFFHPPFNNRFDNVRMMPTNNLLNFSGPRRRRKHDDDIIIITIIRLNMHALKTIYYKRRIGRPCSCVRSLHIIIIIFVYWCHRDRVGCNLVQQFTTYIPIIILYITIICLRYRKSIAMSVREVKRGNR